jgi:hypothetical protein
MYHIEPVEASSGILRLEIEQLIECVAEDLAFQGRRPFQGGNNGMSSYRKQLARDKKRHRKQLRTKGWRPSFLPADAIIVDSLPGMPKLSKVLFDFVDPYVESAPTEESLKKLFGVATIAWNAALLPLDEREALIRETERAVPGEALDDYRMVLASLIERKLAHFSNDRRYIMSLDLARGARGPRLAVTSTWI